MFEFDAGKLIIIGIVALIVIGPKELPRVMRQVGQAVAKLRRLGAEFQAQFMEAMREADAEEMRADVRKLAESAKLDLGVNPLALAKAEMTSALQRPIGYSEVEVAQNTVAPASPDETFSAAPAPAPAADKTEPEVPASTAPHP
jgi:sec-independent protein translocase protein TatB